MSDAPRLPLRTGRKAPRQTIYDADERMVAVGLSTEWAAWLAERVNAAGRMRAITPEEEAEDDAW